MHARIGFASAALLLLLLACGDDDSSGPARIDEVRVTTVAGETDIEVQRGATVQLRARAFRGGAEVPDVQFQWRSEAPTIATVNANGLVQGVEVGQAGIVAEPLGVVGPAGRVSVSVVGVPVARIDITPETAWVDMGDTLTLRATARSANGTAIPDVELTWRSSSSILTVEPTGRVQGVSPGVAEVEAEAWNGVTGKARVHVTPVTGFVPDSGRYGSIMRIQGAGLPPGVSRVEFTAAAGNGRVPAFIRSASETAVEVWVPAEAGTGPLWLGTATDSLLTSRRFEITANDDIFEGADCGAPTCIYLVPVPYQNPSLVAARDDRDNIGFELQSPSPISIYLVDRGARNGTDVIAAFFVRAEPGPVSVGGHIIAANFVDLAYVDSVVYSHPNLPPGLYFVQVYGVSLQGGESVRRPYGLTITRTAQFDIEPDEFEPNDTPSEAAAAPISLPFDRSDLALENPYSVDNYVFDVSEPTTLTVELEGAGANPDLRLIRGDSTSLFLQNVEIVAASTSPGPVEFLEVTVEPGRYGVGVDEFDGQATPSRLRITAAPASSAGPFKLSAPVPSAATMRGLPPSLDGLGRRAAVPVR